MALKQCGQLGQVAQLWRFCWILQERLSVLKRSVILQGTLKVILSWSCEKNLTKTTKHIDPFWELEWIFFQPNKFSKAWYPQPYWIFSARCCIIILTMTEIRTSKIQIWPKNFIYKGLAWQGRLSQRDNTPFVKILFVRPSFEPHVSRQDYFP